MNSADYRQFGLSDADSPSEKAPFTLRKTVIEHAIFCEIVREIAKVHMKGRHCNVAEGVLIVGQTGMGKSTLLEWYAEKFPRSIVNGISKIPIVRVVTPEAPSVKTLAETILRGLGDPAASKGSAQEMTSRILHFFRTCCVELLMIDEFHHFYDGRRGSECHRVSDWLKNLLTLSNKPMVLTGLPRSIAVINMNPQLRRRFCAPVYMRPFDYGTSERQREFRAVLKKLWTEIKLPCIDLHDANIARRFYFASCGLLDYVIKILDEAVTGGNFDNNIGITMETLAAAFQASVWRLVPPELNPFSPTPILRRLDRHLEPFDIWDDPEQYQIANTAGARSGNRRATV
jgi:hypothetical protein